MQFKVPQFIDIEDKVFGPLTFKQFAYLAGGAGFGYLSFRLLPVYLSIFVGPAFVIFALVLAFMKYNDKPFINVVESFVKYRTRSRLYLWRKRDDTSKDKSKQAIADKAIAMSGTKSDSRVTMNGSSLNTLSWNLDVTGSQKQ